MTQQDDARKALGLIKSDQDIPERLRKQIDEAFNDPADSVVTTKLAVVRDNDADEKVRLQAAKDLIVLSRGGTLPAGGRVP